MKSTSDHEARATDAIHIPLTTAGPEVETGRANALLLALGAAMMLVLVFAAYHRYDHELDSARNQLSALVTGTVDHLARSGTDSRPRGGIPDISPLAGVVAQTGYSLLVIDPSPHRASSVEGHVASREDAIRGGAPRGNIQQPSSPLSETIITHLQHSREVDAGQTFIAETPAAGTVAARTMFSCEALPDDDLLICATVDVSGITEALHASLFIAGCASALMTGGALYTLFSWRRRARRRLDELKDTITTLQGQNNACAATATRFVAIFDLADEAMCVMAGGRILISNRAFANLLGTIRPDDTDDGFLHAVHPDDSLYVSRIQGMRQRGEPTPTRVVFRLRDTGQGVRWVQCTSSAIAWDDGRAYLSVLADITDFKQATLLVEQREQALLRIMEQVPHALAVISPEGGLVQTNAAWRDLMHTCAASEMTGTSTIFENPLVIRNGQENAIREALTGVPVETEAHPVPAVHGEARHWLRLRLSPVRDQHGKLQCIVAIYSDETSHAMEARRMADLQHEISRVHEESTSAHGRLHAILEALPWAIVTIDAAGRVTFINDKAAGLAGTTAEAAQGTTVEMLPPALARYAPMLRASLLSGTAQPAIRTEEYIDGRIRHLEAASCPLQVSDRNSGKASFLRIEDVTDRVALEDMMVQSEKMVSVGALAAGMAHEINNPLGAILQGVQNLRRRLTADLPANVNATLQAGLTMEQLRTYVETRQISMLLDGIREAGERAGRIVSHMLTFSRRSQGLHRPAHLGPLIDKALELVETDYDLLKAYDFRQIEVTRDEDPDLPPINCSSSEIEQVILNLLKNAAHAVSVRKDDTPPRIRITTRSEDNGIRLEIADNGPGMTAEQRRRAFEPFFTTRDVGMGTGLGLSICYFIITTKHRGTITIDTAPESGVQFTIRLPF